MKIRYEDSVFHLNDYHFIHLYRNVNASTIGQSNTPHFVVMNGFHDWNGLAQAASESRIADFKHGGYAWHRKNTGEIYPTAGSEDSVQLTGTQIYQLAAYLNNDVDPPKKRQKGDDDFQRALGEVASLKNNNRTNRLAVQWPTVVPRGLSHTYSKDYTEKQPAKPVKGKSRRGDTDEVPVIQRYVWGPNGGAEHPHIHCFVNAEGDVYSAKATLRPSGSTNKRHLLFQDDLKVDRAEALPGDTQALDELDRVMQCVAFGEEFPVTTTTTTTGGGKKARKAAAERTEEPEAEEIDPLLQKYATDHKVALDWIVGVAKQLDDLTIGEIVEYGEDDLKAMLSGPKNTTVTTVTRSQDEDSSDGD